MTQEKLFISFCSGLSFIVVFILLSVDIYCNLTPAVEFYLEKLLIRVLNLPIYVFLGFMTSMIHNALK